MNSKTTSTNDITFAALYEYIQSCETDSYGIHKPAYPSDVKLHVYANKMQVNLLFTTDEDPQGLSHCNFIFNDTIDGKPRSVKIYPCTKPGICNYDAGKEYPIDTEIDSDNSPKWYTDDLDGVAIRESIMDILYPYVNPEQ